MDARFMLVLTSGPENPCRGPRAVLLEAPRVEAVGHRLILQIALAALVADRAVERLIDEQELITPLRAFCARSDLVWITMLSAAHRAGRDRLRCLLLLDEAHPAIAGDRQPSWKQKCGTSTPRR